MPYFRLEVSYRVIATILWIIVAFAFYKFIEDSFKPLPDWVEDKMRNEWLRERDINV